VLNSMKIGWRAWGRSLSVLVNSPIYVLALAVIGGLWCLAGYQWLWLPESSAWVLALAFVWILALAFLALALLAGSVASASVAAAGTDGHLSLRRILCFEKKRLGRTLLIVLAGALLFFALGALFDWVNAHALTVASFLTFHLQRPVSHMLIGEILWVLEALIWLAFAGLLMMWLLSFSNPRQQAAECPRATPIRSLGLSAFLTSLLSAVVFGGMAWRLTTWHPVVKAGGWDYAQLLTRNGLALLLLTLGWLFWVLALARLALSRLMEPAGSLPRS